MMGAAVNFRQETRTKRQSDFGLENALAAYVRNRWPVKTIPYVQHEWGLSEHEAAKVVYANASKNTLKKLLHHKRGGFGLFIQLLADATATSLEAYIREQAENAQRERARWEQEEQRIAGLEARLAESRSWSGSLDQQARAHRPANEVVGPGKDRAPLRGRR